MNLYTYYRSSCSYRVRIALHHKGIKFNSIPVHLVKDGGEQKKDKYLEMNPKGEVPFLTTDQVALGQSVAIFFYLDRAHIEKPLFPKSFPEFEKCVQLVEVINSGIQPLQNISVLKKLKADYNITDDQKIEWCQHFISKGLKAYDEMASNTGLYSMGDEVTAADMFLMPQLYNAKRFNVDLNSFKNLNRIDEACSQLEAFKLAHPDVQPDTPE